VPTGCPVHTASAPPHSQAFIVTATVRTQPNSNTSEAIARRDLTLTVTGNSSHVGAREGWQKTRKHSPWTPVAASPSLLSSPLRPSRLPSWLLAPHPIRQGVRTRNRDCTTTTVQRLVGWWLPCCCGSDRRPPSADSPISVIHPLSSLGSWRSSPPRLSRSTNSADRREAES
jgi:hypothetical protein